MGPSAQAKHGSATSLPPPPHKPKHSSLSIGMSPPYILTVLSRDYNPG